MARTLAALLILAAIPAFAQTSPAILPDLTKTPGAIATSDKAEVCAVVNGLTYTKRHRVWTAQAHTFAKYGVPYSAHHDYEDDDRVPVCLGANNANPNNHWPQPADRIAEGGWGYETKDWMDAAACRMVCHGATSVAEAQGWFLQADWRVPYCQLRPSDQKCANLK